MPALCQCQARAAQLVGSDQRDIPWCGQRASRAASVVEPPSPLCTRTVQASAPAAGAASAGALRSRRTLTQSRVASGHGHACCAPMPHSHLPLLPACSLPAPPQHHAPREAAHLRRGRGARRRQRAQRGRLQGQLQARRRARLAQQEAARIPPRVGGLRSTRVLAPASGTRQRAAARARRQHTASIHSTTSNGSALRRQGSPQVDSSRQRSCRGAGAAAARLRAWPRPSAGAPGARPCGAQLALQRRRQRPHGHAARLQAQARRLTRLALRGGRRRGPRRRPRAWPPPRRHLARQAGDADRDAQRRRLRQRGRREGWQRRQRGARARGCRQRGLRRQAPCS